MPDRYASLRGGELVEEPLDLAGRALVVVRPPSAEELIDEEAFARDEFLPYWAELWPSGLALARRVAQLDLQGRSVLELGCGLGLPSLAAALRGAHVTATDWARDALELLRANAERNGVELTVAHLRWDAPCTGEPADLVLAADVLYEHRHVEQLVGLLPRLVASGGEALVADPGRPYAAPFLRDTAAAGWLVETEADELLTRGGIHRLRRRGGAGVEPTESGASTPHRRESPLRKDHRGEPPCLGALLLA